MGRIRSLASLGVLLVCYPLAGSACSGNDVTSGSGAAVASVVINGLTDAVAVGATRQLTVVLRDADGNTLSARPVTWASTNSSVASINATTGLLTGVASGNATITASYQGIDGSAPVVVGAGTPGALVDPSLLPAATGQHPATGTYGRSLSSGQTYRDPLTNVTVLRVTDARTPRANTGVYGNYSEGGPYISQPWTGGDGHTYYTLWLAGDDGWFVDVQYPALTLSNWRAAPASNETQGAWSLNPATPRIFFYGEGNTVNRYDTQAMALANTGRFPWTIATSVGTNIGWLQTQLNDTWLVGMMNSNSTIVGWRQADGFQRTITESAYGVTIDEPHIDREFPVVYVSRDNVGPQNKVVNLATGVATDPPQADDAINDDHNGVLRGKIVGVSWSTNSIIAVDWQGHRSTVVNPSPTDPFGDYHMSGQWVLNNPDEWFLVDQWQGTGNYKIYRGQIGLASAKTGDVRLLAASDATGGNYAGGQPHPTFSPDGKLMFFCSNMNGSSRFDVFLVKLPTR